MLIRQTPTLKPLAALIAGLAWPMAFAPLGWWPLLPISIGLLWWSLDGCSRRQAFRRCYLFGLGLFGLGVNWLHVSIHVYGFTPLWLAIPMTALFAAGMALYPGLTGWLWHRLGGSPWVFAGVWVLVDWLRGWLLTGFPWLYAGYAMIDTPLANLASLGGIWLLTLASIMTGLSLLVWRQGRQGQLMVGVAALLWALGALVDPASFTTAKGEPRTVALAQGNIPQDIKWLLNQQQATRDIYAELSRQAPANSLVIWPESAITEFYQDALPFLDDQAAELFSRDSLLITGVPWRTSLERDYVYYNSVVVVPTASVYHKQKLVPFGEYVPLQDVLRNLIPFFNLPMSSFSRGSRTQDNLNAGALTIAPFICYEILYPQLVASRSSDSDVLLTISNDAWFGTSAGPLQHFQMARLRAIETGRWLIRGTNNGVTALVRPDGGVAARLPQFTRELLVGEVQPRSGQTPWQRSGQWPWLVLAGAMVMAGRRAATQLASAAQDG